MEIAPKSSATPQPPVEDLFADTIPLAQQTRAQTPAWVPPPFPVDPRPHQAIPTSPPPRQSSGDARLPRGRLIALIVTVVLAVSVIGFVYGPAVWNRVVGNPRVNTISNINQVRPVNTVVPTRTNQQIQGVVVDSDGDGLLDTEEQELGTDAKAIDSDSDGLTDRQEVQIYTTNPKNRDTDRDGYSDGEEVRNFYNPNGTGRLLDVTEAINQLENTNVNQ